MKNVIFVNLFYLDHFENDEGILEYMVGSILTLTPYYYNLGFSKSIHSDSSLAIHSQSKELVSMVELAPPHFKEGNDMLIEEIDDINLELGDTPKIIKVRTIILLKRSPIL